MANCFTRGHHLPRTTTEWDSALVWYLRHSQEAINPDPTPPPPPPAEREWGDTLRRLRRTNFSCRYSGMDDGPSHRAQTDPPCTANTEKRLQYDDKFQHPLYEPTFRRAGPHQPVTGVTPRTFAPPYVPLPDAAPEPVAEFRRYEAAQRRWSGVTSSRVETKAYTVFH